MKAAEPLHSPPAEKPCKSRATTSRSGANTPIWSYVGSSPIMRVETPIRMTAAASVVLRPILSPKDPNTMAPRGRMKKATAKTANVASREVTRFSEGKNCVAMIVAK